jgi:hypothetical protein
VGLSSILVMRVSETVMNISLIRLAAAVVSLLVTVVLFDSVASLAEPTQAAKVATRVAPASTLALAQSHAGRH